jgi:ABC-type polysaccharide/polyol phosphate transport system ATPase subunit
MSSDLAGPSAAAIEIADIGKVYHIYDRPQDRLKQAFFRWRRHQYFREFWALRHISLDIRPGETVGIVGRNGAGKSTLLQIIAGTLTPSEGRALVRGRVVPLLELGSGFNPEFTGRENVFLYGQLLGLTLDFMRARFDEIVKFADIGMFIDQPLKTYSSGMHARLAFSVAAFVDPDILIVDEILAVGDAAFQAKCARVFHRFRDNGRTILLVSHDPYLIRNFCQRALYLHEGRQVAFGPAEQVADKYARAIEAKQMADGSIENSTAPAGGGHDLSGLGLFRISAVELLDPSDAPTRTVRSGDAVRLRFTYRRLRSGRERVTFVFSLYRHDGLYICGNTTLMDRHEPFDAGAGGVITVDFPRLRLLAGNYVWRVAIDDDRGYGIYTEMTGACPFQVVDAFQAVGLFDLERTWRVEIEPADGTH